MNDEPPPFVLADGLEHDLMVLEASAGTGKTFALAALSTLAIGRGRARIGELCVATFTEAATAELRGRFRERMARAVTFLDSEFDREPVDDLERIMATLDEPLRTEWLVRLRQAVRDFDTASITTIHGFCSRVIGSVAGADAGLRLTADADDVDEVVRDVLLSRLDDPAALSIDHGRLLEGVRLALSLPAARFDLIEPDDPELVGTDPARIARAEHIAEVAEVVTTCCAEVRRRRRARSVRTFDDLLADTRRLLTGPDAPSIATELRRRFRVVLIDEFQDTDQVQWDILRCAFVEPVDDAPTTTVVVVGDPKQSIYRFRSAELSAYLAARDRARADGGVVVSLTTNHRSDQVLLDGLNALFDGFTFGDERIAYQTVIGVDPDGVPRLRGAGRAAVEFRSPDPSKTLANDVRRAVTDDVCDVVVDLLSGPEVRTDVGWERLVPSDIGILVSRNDEALELAAALRARNVPAVASSGDNVLGSPAAAQWRMLLHALDRPSAGGTVRLAALSWFDTLTAADLAALDDDQTQGDGDALAGLFDRYRGWSRLLIEDGLPSLLSALRAHGLSQRVLSRSGGERDLTDLEHIAELLQTRTGGRPTSAGTLLEILDELADASSEEETRAELYDRRIDRDDDTVRIMTVHKAKGLQFKVVLVPSLWSARQKRRNRIAHASIDGERRLDLDYVVGPDDPGFDRVYRASLDEEAGEERRKLYVALTRAEHRLVVWYPQAYTWSGGKPVALRDLLTHAAETTVKKFDPTRLVERAGPQLGFIDAPAESHGRSLAPIEPTERRLATATAPSIDRQWRQWSFTGVTRVLDDDRGAVAPFVGGGFDEPAVTEEIDEELVDAALPLRTMTGGRDFGVLVHEILERTDFAVPDDELVAALRDECGRSLHHRSVRGVDPDRLAAGLAVALRAPLGGPLDDRPLTHLTRRQRLDELHFDLPLARFDVADIATAVVGHLPDDDPFRPWFESAITRHLPIEGMLTGSIDLVARTTIDGRDRYWLADYKTNVIADGIDFDDVDLVAEMIRDDYVLQSTLYQVALHRFLRWRLGDHYDPATDLLGSAYLFVRGMDPGRPADDTRGVHWWALPPAALDALDALFATARIDAA